MNLAGEKFDELLLALFQPGRMMRRFPMAIVLLIPMSWKKVNSKMVYWSFVLEDMQGQIVKTEEN